MEQLPLYLRRSLYKEWYAHVIRQYKRLLRPSIETNNVEQLKQVLPLIPHTNVKAISWAVYHGHTECAKLLIEAKFPLTSKATYWALSRGRTECLLLLLDAGCRLCKNPLQVAKYFKQFETYECLKYLATHCMLPHEYSRRFATLNM